MSVDGFTSLGEIPIWFLNEIGHHKEVTNCLYKYVMFDDERASSLILKWI